jgi:hypothetical protein
LSKPPLPLWREQAEKTIPAVDEDVNNSADDTTPPKKAKRSMTDFFKKVNTPKLV